MNYYDIVKKLIGNIIPVGESNSDEKRLTNLNHTIELVERLLLDIEHVTNVTDNGEYSIVEAKKTAKKFLKNLNYKDQFFI